MGDGDQYWKHAPRPRGRQLRGPGQGGLLALMAFHPLHRVTDNYGHWTLVNNVVNISSKMKKGSWSLQRFNSVCLSTILSELLNKNSNVENLHLLLLTNELPYSYLSDETSDDINVPNLNIV